jgi:chromosome segregation ATPase
MTQLKSLKGHSSSINGMCRIRRAEIRQLWSFSQSEKRLHVWRQEDCTERDSEFELSRQKAANQSLETVCKRYSNLLDMSHKDNARVVAFAAQSAQELSIQIVQANEKISEFHGRDLRHQTAAHSLTKEKDQLRQKVERGQRKLSRAAAANQEAMAEIEYLRKEAREREVRDAHTIENLHQQIMSERAAAEQQLMENSQKEEEVAFLRQQSSEGSEKLHKVAVDMQHLSDKINGLYKKTIIQDNSSTGSMAPNSPAGGTAEDQLLAAQAASQIDSDALSLDLMNLFSDISTLGKRISKVSTSLDNSRSMHTDEDAGGGGRHGRQARADKAMAQLLGSTGSSSQLMFSDDHDDEDSPTNPGYLSSPHSGSAKFWASGSGPMPPAEEGKQDLDAEK